MQMRVIKQMNISRSALYIQRALLKSVIRFYEFLKHFMTAILKWLHSDGTESIVEEGMLCCGKKQRTF